MKNKKCNAAPKESFENALTKSGLACITKRRQQPTSPQGGTRNGKSERVGTKYLIPQTRNIANNNNFQGA
ncbi:MAG: hypothetical protein LBC63_03140 [Holophagales bacterium]|jgi:hypothetical protein|nr:hypothetical protein [Holophagales bacterium]